MNNYTEIELFGFYVIIGIAIGLFYDLFRALRKVVKSNDKVTLVQDLLFLSISCYIILISIIKLNNGEVRFYLFFSIFTGIAVYSLTISNVCVIIIKYFFEVTLKFLKFIFLYIKISFCQFSKKIRRIFHRNGE